MEFYAAAQLTVVPRTEVQGPVVKARHPDLLPPKSLAKGKTQKGKKRENTTPNAGGSTAHVTSRPGDGPPPASPLQIVLWGPGPPSPLPPTVLVSGVVTVVIG